MGSGRGVNIKLDAHDDTYVLRLMCQLVVYGLVKGAMRDPMGVAWDTFFEVEFFSFLQSLSSYYNDHLT